MMYAIWYNSHVCIYVHIAGLQMIPLHTYMNTLTYIIVTIYVLTHSTSSDQAMNHFLGIKSAALSAGTYGSS